MERDELKQLIYRIVTTEDEEIDCGQLFELIAQYVELEVSGEEAARIMPMVYQHLAQCDDCSEMYETLRELAVLEEQNALPDVEDLLEKIFAGSPASSVEVHPNSSAVSRIPPISLRANAQPARLEDSALDAQKATQHEAATILRPATWLRWRWVAAAAALLLVVVVSVWGWFLPQGSADVKSVIAFVPTVDRVIRMQGTELDPNARGLLLIDDSDKQGLLILSGINPAPSGRIYQIWVMAERGPISVGAFNPGTSQRGSTWVDLSETPMQFASLEFTSEPEGGSTAPTSLPVCILRAQAY